VYLFKSRREFILICHFQHSFNAECYASEGGRLGEDYVNTANDVVEERLICKVNTAACEGTKFP
jgi:hypothetical protein